MEQPLFLPRSADGFCDHTFEQYIHNILLELETISFTAAERSEINHVNLLQRYLHPPTRPFFLYHFAPLATIAVQTLFSRSVRPEILDLGCGTGTMSILFALLGAHVTGIDCDPQMISICNKRREYYERFGGPLELQFCEANALKFQIADLKEPIDGVYSLFAFSWMAPNGAVLRNLKKGLNAGAIVVISDSNEISLANRFRRRQALLSPDQMRSEFERNGFHTLAVKYDCILPPFLAQNRAMIKLSNVVERALASFHVNRWVAVSYTLIAEA